GGVGTGKSTLVNAVLADISRQYLDERILVLEDTVELQVSSRNVVAYRTSETVDMRRLIRMTLRMRPDRIIVGEVRGAETLDMLQAMNTGHEGSLTTIHANAPRDALSRLETLVLTAGVDLPHRAIREQIASAFDLLVQIQRLVDGSRRISHISEVIGMESDVVTLQDIFVATPPPEDEAASVRRLLSPLRATGLKPHFLDRLAANNVVLPPGFFGADEVDVRAAFSVAGYGGMR
ncbi:MAG: CpaF family protein, partial [Actinobacteria bacterium]|nr:CpaF family protein [Actinomycetota bacterium]